MVVITTLVAPSGECYEVKAGMVTLQCNNCVIHLYLSRLSASEASFSVSQLHKSQWGAIQIQLPYLFKAFYLFFPNGQGQGLVNR